MKKTQTERGMPRNLRKWNKRLLKWKVMEIRERISQLVQDYRKKDLRQAHVTKTKAFNFVCAVTCVCWKSLKYTTKHKLRTFSTPPFNWEKSSDLRHSPTKLEKTHLQRQTCKAKIRGGIFSQMT
ncbi:hypothetical protein CHS0354_004823 [Potamilus streckersoni]|uniref:Uncharacterized protein n=1 Tax=Potamilus streckersoni TaxID=2493646 RepID=A0AAE0VSH9_9BIVA|nr:hypothetical protein CHS0354_004823 [Potamilus streckersoni]